MTSHRLSLSLVVLLLLLGGCDSDSDDGGGLALGTITARVDGQPFTSSFAIATPCGICSALGHEGIEVAGLDASGLGVGFGLVPFSGEGTYDLSPPEGEVGSGGVVDRPDGRSYATDYTGGSGTVTVTRSTAGAIEGTFHFTALDGEGGEAVHVTDGRFNVPLTGM